MKSLAKNIFFVAVMVLYIVSTMGYGVHRCTTDGTASLILLFGESPCEYVHSHVDRHGNIYTHLHAPGEHDQACGHVHHGDGHDGCSAGHHHEGEHDGCCSTDVYVLTQDQKTVEDSNQFLMQAHLVAEQMLDVHTVQDSFALLSADRTQLPQALHPKEGQQALLCTFRI